MGVRKVICTLSQTQTLTGTKKDASVKTLTISGNPEPSLKLALGFETLWGEFNQNKQTVLAEIARILFTFSHFFCCRVY